MVSTWRFSIYICILIARGTVRKTTATPLKPTIGGVSDLLYVICETVTQKSLENSKVTWIFAPYTAPEYRDSLNYLWSLPNALVFLAKEPALLRHDDREIVISWESDNPRRLNLGAVWSAFSQCGHSFCDRTQERLDLWQVDRRILIQIRELTPDDFVRRKPRQILRSLSGRLRFQSYLHVYRRVFVALGSMDRDELHSSFVVKRSSLESANNVIGLLAKNFDLDDARGAFDLTDIVSNSTEMLSLNLFAISSSTGDEHQDIRLNTCVHVSSIPIAVFSWYRMDSKRAVGGASSCEAHMNGVCIGREPFSRRDNVRTNVCLRSARKIIESKSDDLLFCVVRQK